MRDTVGVIVGADVWVGAGDAVGEVDGLDVAVGIDESEGDPDGRSVGGTDGAIDIEGGVDGISEGELEGSMEGYAEIEGCSLGCADGEKVGPSVGERVGEGENSPGKEMTGLPRRVLENPNAGSVTVFPKSVSNCKNKSVVSRFAKSS